MRSKKVIIEEDKWSDYAYRVTCWRQEGVSYERCKHWNALPKALQDAHGYLCEEGGEVKVNKPKIHDEVRVRDTSWSLELRKGVLTRDPSTAGCGWKVVATGLRLPTSKEAYGVNDTIIVEAGDKTRVVFIRYKYLEVLNVCPKCGTRIKK